VKSEEAKTEEMKMKGVQTYFSFFNNFQAFVC